MFKSILPSRRIISSDFTMVTPPDDCAVNGKENYPQAVPQAAARPPRQRTKSTNARPPEIKGAPLKEQDKPMEEPAMNDAFDKLLDDLQIPKTLRPKLINMDLTVKAAMLKSSQTITLKPLASPPSTPPALRRARSSDSLSSPRPQKTAMGFEFPNPPKTAGISGAHPSMFTSGSNTMRVPSNHARGISVDAMQTLARGQAPPVIPNDLPQSKSSKDKLAKNVITPGQLCSVLLNTSSTQLETETVKKLRLLLRNESASWTQNFLKLGGYSALLTRLNEILEVEWREEQHDDQMLHELLRCFKALSTSSIGCFALRSSCPTPFAQLVALLYSDKKPGDVATRQLIVELLLILFDLYPSFSLPGNNAGRPRREVWGDVPTSNPSSSLITLPTPHKTFYSLIRALILTPAPSPSESPAVPVSPHAFIESLHRPRIYKTYLQELSDVCRDYFWIFCHPNNMIWNLNDTDEGKVERPRAPGGMTGGVEFEAMGYLTTQLKLLNAIATASNDLNLPKENDQSAHRFHTDLFLSGLERILLIARKASTTYYPTLHLEIARYVTLAGRAQFELPWTVSRLIGLPPSALCKHPRPREGSASVPGSPSRRMVSATSGAPALPSPKKIEPIKFD